MARRELKPRSLEREVYDALREDILRGELSPGEPLVEAQLAGSLGVSKTPVREALIRLQRDGLVTIIPYRGARVATPSPDDVRAACEVRDWIETRIAYKLAEAPPPELIDRLRENLAVSERALASGDEPTYLATVQEFSEVMIEASGNRYARQILSNLRNFLGVIASASRAVPGRRERSIREHRAIYRAIARGDADAAEQATRRHVRSILDDSLRALASMAADSDGRGS